MRRESLELQISIGQVEKEIARVPKLVTLASVLAASKRVHYCQGNEDLSQTTQDKVLRTWSKDPQAKL